ncbi:MAG: hypothetical protein E6J21_11160 [Chloroflexota bacterium]|nr:MAG: hypothetical protein E6J21_11160 [Chloroflexota bacterium]
MLYLYVVSMSIAPVGFLLYIEGGDRHGYTQYRLHFRRYIPTHIIQHAAQSNSLLWRTIEAGAKQQSLAL